jgi:hypothetical protein
MKGVIDLREARFGDLYRTRQGDLVVFVEPLADGYYLFQTRFSYVTIEIQFYNGRQDLVHENREDIVELVSDQGRKLDKIAGF